MNWIVPIVVVAAFAAFVYFDRRQIVRVAEKKLVALKCSFCGCLVVRYEQLHDSRIQCANCKPKN